MLFCDPSDFNGMMVALSPFIPILTQDDLGQRLSKLPPSAVIHIYCSTRR